MAKKTEDLAEYLVQTETKPTRSIRFDPSKPGQLFGLPPEESAVQDRIGFTVWDPAKQPAYWNGLYKWDGTINWSSRGWSYDWPIVWA